VSRRVKLITENWFAVNPGVTGLISGGFRFVGDRLSADFAFAGATGTEAACCLPMLNFVWSFGGGR
jgi:energy-converting hydrogenase Eha subunit B